MANVFCVSYDLTHDPTEYSDLYDELTSCRHWWHFLEFTWLVVLDESAADLWERLKPHLNRSDRMLIIAVGAEFRGSLSKEAWDWIRQHVDSGVPQHQ